MWFGLYDHEFYGTFETKAAAYTWADGDPKKAIFSVPVQNFVKGDDIV